VVNPFLGYTNGVNADTTSQQELYVVDGSETGQVSPSHRLPQRSELMGLQENPIWSLIQP
jgi:hypothetical protein